MKPLLVIFSCWRDDHQGKNDACRKTYLKEWGDLVDHRFVVGQLQHSGGLLQEDMVYVDVPDEYGYLPAKQRAAYKELIKTPYEHFFICYTDTWIDIPKLLAHGYGAAYMGVSYEGRAAGGFGYWLSKQAMEKIAHLPTEPEKHSDKLDGDQLGQLGIHLTEMPRGITKHLSKDTNFYEAQWMYEAHNDAAL